MTFRIAAIASALAAIPASLTAQTAFYGDHSIVGHLCAGYACTTSESYGVGDTLKLKHEANAILFDDTSTGSGYPSGDWRLKANDSAQFGASYFALEDADGAGAVVMVEDGARASAFHVDNSGHIGLGTALPNATLHMVSGSAPGLRFGQDGSGGNTPYDWQLAADDASFRLHDLTTGTTPLVVLPGAPPADAVTIDGRAWLGIGYAPPAAPLHILKSTGSAKARIEETATGTSPRTLLELLNNGRPEIVMGNTSTNREWSFGAGTNFVLKQGILGSDPSAKTKLFEIRPNGDATLTGSLTTGGTTCGDGCDQVFSDDYDLPSIEDHAEQMFTLGHLPNVGPTREGEPLNVTDKLGRVLNELEHAHIYIARQETVIAGLKQSEALVKTQLAIQTERIARLEATVARLITQND